MLLVRRLGAVALVVAALIVWFTLKPSATASPSSDFGSAISAAMSDDDVNQSTSEYAAQQTVSNGWVARDLLQIIAKEQNAALSPTSAPRDDRIPAELLLVVFGLALMAGTGPARTVLASPVVTAGEGGSTSPAALGSIS